MKTNVNCQGKMENRDESRSEYLDDSDLLFIIESTLVPSSSGTQRAGHVTVTQPASQFMTAGSGKGKERVFQQCGSLAMLRSFAKVGMH